MTKTIIHAQGLSKSYVLSHEAAGYVSIPTLRDSVRNALLAPLQRLTGHSTTSANTSELFYALKDVSFDIQEGESVAIIGRNGAGKSTLLKLLSRIIRPSSGKADVYGRMGVLLEVGTGFHPELSGRENIYMNAAILGMKRPEINRRFDEIVEFAEVEQFLDTPIKHYSSGMVLRLGFAVAAHLEPEILIVDEVLAVGDAAFQKKCLGKMGDVANEGRTVIFVSHNLNAITQLCQRGIWLEQGEVRMDDTAEKAVEAYISEQVQYQAQRTWDYPGDAPGDERIRLIATRIVQDNKVTSAIDINRAVQIEIDFRALQPVEDLVGSIFVYNSSGICAFGSADWRHSKLAKGLFRKVMHIPAQTLAEGTFTMLLQLTFFEPDIHSVILHDALGFEALDSDHPESVRGPFKSFWPGAVRLALHWDEAIPLEVNS